MHWLNNLSFKLKLRLPLAFIAILMLGIVSFGISLQKDVAQENQVLLESNFPATEYLLEADRDLYQSVLALTKLISFPADGSFREDAASNSLQTKQRLQQYSKLMSHDQSSKEMVSETLDEHRIYEQTLQQVLQKQANELNQNDLAQVEANFTILRGKIDQLSEITHSSSINLKNDIQALEARAINKNISLLIVGLIVCITAGFFLPRMTSTRLNCLLSQFTHVADGDLTSRLPITGNDEFGRAAKEINTFIQMLHSSISDISSVSQMLSEQANHVQTQGEANILTTKNQLEDTKLTVNATTDMRTTVDEITLSTSEAANAARLAQQNVVDGLNLVLNMANEIQELATEIDASAGAIGDVKEESANVGSVLDVIRGIAEQTNLLALNAAIEAARAGEQGRGFAVVADEVRTLAQRTQESTQEIEDVIEKLQSSAEDSVQRMNANRDKVIETAGTATNAAASLEKINESVQSIASLNIQIAGASEEQSAANAEIGTRMDSIALSTQTTNETAEKLGSSALKLRELSTILNTSVSQFTV